MGKCQSHKGRNTDTHKKTLPVTGRKVNPASRWRLDERGELIARGIATGGDTVKEGTESPVRERKKKKEDWVKVEREENEETKGEGEREQRGLEALFVGTVSHNSSSSSPFDLSLWLNLPLWRHRCLFYKNTHTQFPMSKLDNSFLFLSVFLLSPSLSLSLSYVLLTCLCCSLHTGVQINIW